MNISFLTNYTKSLNFGSIWEKKKHNFSSQMGEKKISLFDLDENTIDTQKLNSNS